MEILWIIVPSVLSAALTAVFIFVAAFCICGGCRTISRCIRPDWCEENQCIQTLRCESECCYNCASPWRICCADLLECSDCRNCPLHALGLLLLLLYWCCSRVTRDRRNAELHRISRIERMAIENERREAELNAEKMLECAKSKIAWYKQLGANRSNKSYSDVFIIICD